MNTSTSRTPRVGVSACLLGQPVRYDGGHKRQRYVADVLGKHFEWSPVCPEMAMGLGAPRDTLRLVDAPVGPRLVNPKTGEDHTEDMKCTAELIVEKLSSQRLAGFVLARKSPTCGMERVKVYGKGGVPRHDGEGLFAEALRLRYPNLPLEEDGRLNDPRLRENFVTRVFAYDRWLRYRAEDGTKRGLIAFHTGAKMLVLAHDQARYRRMGPIVASAGRRPDADTLDRYEGLLMEALRRPATRRGHKNALQHLAGRLRGLVGREERADIQRVIEEYRQGWVPLVTATTLLGHHLRRLDDPWVEQQLYLTPHPRELALRSAV